MSDDFIDRVADELELGDVAAALAEAVAVTPPDALRGSLLREANARPRPLAAPLAAPEVYTRRVAAMAELLASLAPDDWTAHAAPYAWTVHRLLAHLTVIEEYTARQFGLTASSPSPAAAPSTVNHLEMDADTMAQLAGGSPAETVRRWHAAASQVVDHVSSSAYDPSASVPLHAWPFDADTALVARSFEIWTHADDIRRATGRPLDVLAPGELRTMSSTSVSGLPVLLAVVDGPPLQPTRVVLTGAGGGTFDLVPDAPGAGGDQHLLVVDVVDYCRLVARRIDSEDLRARREGDPVLLAALLRAARVIAV